MSSSPASPFTNVSAFLPLKLDRHNYPLWHAQFVRLLRSRSVMLFVDETSKCPSAFLLDDDGQLTDDINPLFEPWIHFAPFSHNRVIQLHGELFNLCLGDLSIADFLDKINTLANQLAMSSAHMSDPDLITMIMNNVGPLYENTVASIQARETPISYAALETLLLNAEKCHLTFTLYGDTHVPTLTAIAANCGRHVHAPAGFVCSGGCASNAHRPNGNVATPPHGRPGVLGVGPSSTDCPPLKCQICCRNDHSAIDYYNRMNTAYEGRVPSARLTAFAAQARRVTLATPALTT
ncbi:unnamed protein product [Malus baccata var. baccata]